MQADGASDDADSASLGMKIKTKQANQQRHEFSE
jgi:hypothetical protein